MSEPNQLSSWFVLQGCKQIQDRQECTILTKYGNMNLKNIKVDSECWPLTCEQTNKQKTE